MKYFRAKFIGGPANGRKVRSRTPFKETAYAYKDNDLPGWWVGYKEHLRGVTCINKYSFRNGNYYYNK